MRLFINSILKKGWRRLQLELLEVKSASVVIRSEIGQLKIAAVTNFGYFTLNVLATVVDFCRRLFIFSYNTWLLKSKRNSCQSLFLVTRNRQMTRLVLKREPQSQMNSDVTGRCSWRIFWPEASNGRENVQIFRTKNKRWSISTAKIVKVN